MHPKPNAVFLRFLVSRPVFLRLTLFALPVTVCTFVHAQSAAVVTFEQEVAWHPLGHPEAAVGNWMAEGAHFEGEIPQAIWEVPIASRWQGVEVLDFEEDWAAVDSSDLVLGQTRALHHRPPTPFIRVTENSIQIAQPLLRWSPSAGRFERLMAIRGVLGESPIPSASAGGQRMTSWPASTPLAEGEFLRLAIPDDGVYRIDATLLNDAGLDPDTIDPRRLVLYGNGGHMLPMDNAAPRPLGLKTAGLSWVGGSSDSSWAGGGAFLFFGQGPDAWTFDTGSQRFSHQKHPYSDSAFYFLRLDAPLNVPGARVPAPSSPVGVGDGQVVNAYTQCVFHESETHSPNRSGREWFGERFLPNEVRTIALATPYARDEPGRLVVRAAVKSLGTPSTLRVTAGDADLAITPSATSDFSTSNVANIASATWTGFVATGVDAGAGLVAEATLDASVSDAVAWLDYVTLEQPSDLRFGGNALQFAGVVDTAAGTWTTYELTADGGLSWVWDVTDPSAPQPMNVVPVDGEPSRYRFDAMKDSLRTFCAYAGYGAQRPAVGGRVRNNNLHALDSADLVVLTVPAYWEEATDLAQIHAEEGLRTAVVLQEDVFNAFSSGNPDPTAIKMMMQMLWDKAELAQDTTLRPKYLQIFGDGTFVNRNLPQNTPYVITYQSENSISPTGSYVSDDYFGFLGEQYGEGIGDKMAIGVGRIPCSSQQEAAQYLAKVQAYVQGAGLAQDAGNCADGDTLGRFGDWRNRIVFVADDMDGNGGPTEKVHMTNSDEHAGKIRALHNDFEIEKIYLDAYPQLSTPGGERYPDAEDAIERSVARGALIVNYIGHGGERGWAHERVLDNATVQEWTNLAHMPLFMTATCELARFDDPEAETAGELTVMNPDGGAIAMLTTTRVVFSGSNQQLNRAFYDIVLEDTPQNPLRLGDIARVTKNDPQVANSSNKRNFSLLGDVALRLAYPEFEVKTSAVPDTLRALDVVQVTGYVSDANGDTLTDFNGLVYPKVYDKMTTVTTLNNDAGPTPHVFEVYRNVLHKGVAEVANGTFAFSFSVPADIDQTFGPGRISFYATDGTRDGHGHDESFVVGGFNPDAPVDMTPPTIALHLNDTNFVSGGLASPNPTLFARLSDASGINASGLGIGHDIKAVLDGASDAAIVLNEFYTADLNTYVSGTVRYGLADLSPGLHTIEFVAWDVANNKGTASLDFVVAESLAAAIAEFTSFPNPANEEVTFRFEHNLACQFADIVIDVTDMQGRRVAELSTTMEASGFRSQPVTWDLRNGPLGGQVGPGFYVARMRLTTAAGEVVQYADKILVLRP